jgi:ribosomal 50S subunit-recycling heat shock protein
MKENLTVPEEFKDMRLDVYLANALPQVPSRMFIKKMIDAGQVKVNGRQEKTKYKIAPSDNIEIDINEEAWAPR